MPKPWVVVVACLLMVLGLCAGVWAQPCRGGGSAPVIVQTGETTMWWTDCYPTAVAPRGRCLVALSDPSGSAALVGRGCGARMTGWALASPRQQETMGRCPMKHHLVGGRCPMMAGGCRRPICGRGVGAAMGVRACAAGGAMGCKAAASGGAGCGSGACAR